MKLIAEIVSRSESHSRGRSEGNGRRGMGRSVSVSGKLTGDSTCRHRGARRLVYIHVWAKGLYVRGNDGVIAGMTRNNSN
jgi:hypothetical protein